MARSFLVVLVLALMLPATPVFTAGCVGLSKIKEQNPGSVMDNLAAGLQKIFSEAKEEQCGSLVSVMDKVLNRKRAGGRRLEETKPLDVVAAQANLDQALQDPQIRARFDDASASIPDENARLFYEAAILDEEGYYDARELRIAQLLEKMK